MNCDLGAEEYLIEELRKIPAKSHDDFDETVSLKIRRLSRVVSTMTLNVVNTQ